MILHRSTKFNPNGITHGKVLTSYRFTKNLVLNVAAKFDVPSFNSSQDMEGVRIFQK